MLKTIHFYSAILANKKVENPENADSDEDDNLPLHKLLLGIMICLCNNWHEIKQYTLIMKIQILICMNYSVY